MKRTIRRAARLLLLIALTIVAGTYIPRPLWQSANVGASPRDEILLLSNPIHTDIAIPIDDAIRARFAFLAEAGVPVDNPGARYLILGWGGRSFYLETPRWVDIKPMPVLRALTLDHSVMHVDVAGNLHLDDPTVTRLAISAQGRERMIAYILSSFAQVDGHLQPIAGTRYGKYDAFYEANGWFNALRGCNTWTARALREAGLRTGLWNPVPQTLAISLKLYN